MSGNCKYFAIFWFMGLACLASFAFNTPVNLYKISWIFCGKEEALLDKEFG
jgi:hypothetical protein